jgi:hypothetical protein
VDVLVVVLKEFSLLEGFLRKPSQARENSVKHVLLHFTGWTKIIEPLFSSRAAFKLVA